MGWTRASRSRVKAWPMALATLKVSLGAAGRRSIRDSTTPSTESGRPILTAEREALGASAHCPSSHRTLSASRKASIMDWDSVHSLTTDDGRRTIGFWILDFG